MIIPDVKIKFLTEYLDDLFKRAIFGDIETFDVALLCVRFLRRVSASFDFAGPER